MKTERAREIFDRIKNDGIQALNEFIISKKEEELFLDFKRSDTKEDSLKLSDNDRNNFSKAISGFGNSEGGVIVWGIDCSKSKDGTDVANMKVPIKNVSRFISWLQSAVSGLTVPPHAGVENIKIEESPNEGYVVSYIPKSMKAPHQTFDYKYYMRAGSSFSPVPHGILSGMFGGRPQPHIALNFPIEPAHINGNIVTLKLGLSIINDSNTIARDSFVITQFFSIPNHNCRIGIQLIDNNHWNVSKCYGMHYIIICNDYFRIPPSGIIHIANVIFDLIPPFEKELHIQIIVGCDGSEPYHLDLKTDATNIIKYYNLLLQYPNNHEYISCIFDIQRLQ